MFENVKRICHDNRGCKGLEVGCITYRPSSVFIQLEFDPGGCMNREARV